MIVRRPTVKIGLMLLLAATATACPDLVAQSTSQIGGAVTLGVAPSVFYQPPAVIDEPLLTSLMSLPVPSILIAVDDELHVELYGVKDFETTARVDRDGTIALPYIGSVSLAGLSVHDAELRIADELVKQQIVLRPAVKLRIEQQPSAVVVVSGEVPHSGTFSIYTNPTLDQALASAGGFLQNASPVVWITRPGISKVIYVPLGPDPSHAKYGGLRLVSGDRITVSRVGTYYVVGAVKTQGAYTLKSATPTTVAQAISAAGGFGFEAVLDSTQIARTEGDHRILLSVKAGQILKGKQVDVALKSDDIVYVPTSQAKAAIKGGATGLIVSLASTYIYAHP